MMKLSFLFLLVWLISTLIEANKVLSPKPSLKQFRDDYKSVKKTCQEVGFISYCNPKAGRRTNQVAFTAVLSQSIHTKSHPKTLPFKTIKANLGYAFSSNTQRFSTPVTGMYGFSWSVANNNNYDASSTLVKNGKMYHSTNCNTVGANHQQCGDTVVMWLKKNDQVWVTTRKGNFYAVAPFTSFSGWKLN